ncbi:glycoside hydrolase family 55 protein [Phlebopus sp. FC_14]|nr:glycoside hydrolase family 55 protein [Phlebopus sp. FC_14]
MPCIHALGSSCPSPLTRGLAAPEEPYWLEKIKHQGTSAFNPDKSYQVFRNVKDFGAKGDGVTDDTVAINLAMSSGNRCGQGCQSSTLTPAIIYFPPGKYVVSSPIETYYYTQMIGDAKRPPTLLASPNFVGLAVIDADPYIPGGNGAQWFINQNNFYRSVRNIIIDLRQMPAAAPAIGLHWQVSQSTSLMNVMVEMSRENGTQHQVFHNLAEFVSCLSGGFMGDITFNGGKIGIAVGNQQFTVRNLTVNNAVVAVAGAWNWGWTYQGVSINNCQVGFNLTTGGTTAATQTVGSEAIIDAVVMNTDVFISTTNSSNGTLAGSLVLNNIVLHNVPVAVGVQNGDVVLEGSKDSMCIDSWGQGNVYVGNDGIPKFTQGPITPPQKPWNIVDANGKIFGKSHPQYADYALDQIVSVKSHGAAGDGITDDTAALQKILNKFAGCKLIFFDAGTYYITDTLVIPAGSQVTGEAWSVILGGGPKFEDEKNPRVMVQVGEPQSTGILEITDIIFSTVGPAPGAIVIEWNVHEPWNMQGAAGMWDTAGTNLQISQCPAGTLSPSCMAAFMAMHLTQGSSAYLEGTWIWTADHDLDDPESRQTSIFTGRGLLSESLGPVWLIGTAEHNVLYQYNLYKAQNHWIGFAQTETPYYQPVPPAPAPYSIQPSYHDPQFVGVNATAWALYVQSSRDIILFGGGFYSFFQNYTQDCLATFSCQNQIFNIDSDSTIQVYSLSTVGTTYQLSISHRGIVLESDNQDGFQQTLTAWTP